MDFVQGWFGQYPNNRGIASGTRKVGISTYPGESAKNWKKGKLKDGAIGKIILDAGLTPIIEPEVTITISEKSQAEESLKKELIKYLNRGYNMFLPFGYDTMKNKIDN